MAKLTEEQLFLLFLMTWPAGIPEEAVIRPEDDTDEGWLTVEEYAAMIASGMLLEDNSEAASLWETEKLPGSPEADEAPAAAAETAETVEAAAAEAEQTAGESAAEPEEAAEEAAAAEQTAEEGAAEAEEAAEETVTEAEETAEAAEAAETAAEPEEAAEESAEAAEAAEEAAAEPEEAVEEAAAEAEEAVEETAAGPEEAAEETAEAAETAEEAVTETEETAEAAEAAEEAVTEAEEEAEETAEEEPAVPEETPAQKQGFLARLFKGLSKTRSSIAGSLSSVFGLSRIDEDFYEELEEILIMGDMGVQTTERVLDELREQVAEQRIKEPAACRQLLISSIRSQMQTPEDAYAFEDQRSVVLVIGVNGVGKTTTIGKLASKWKAAGKKVVMAAGDTFRAAAAEQLKTWAERAGTDIIAGQEGSDPGAVVYDAVAAAKARKADILICDTAGRLHNKKNLMEELRKICRIIAREYPEAHLETLLVLDGTTGQNAMAQAKSFSEITDITGIIMTKLDGTAKGGIAVAVQSELGIPIKYIGVGEQIDDLQKFDPDTFVKALFEDMDS